MTKKVAYLPIEVKVMLLDEQDVVTVSGLDIDKGQDDFWD